MGKLSKAVVDVEDDEDDLEYDEDEFEDDEEADESEDDDDPDEDTEEVWADYLPTLLDAIRDGKLDRFLKDIGYEARERFMSLPANAAYAGTQAPIVRSGRSGKIQMDNSAMPILGRNGAVLPTVRTNVGLSGAMPTGSFRVPKTGHAYSKEAFIGRLLEVRTDIRYRRGTTIKAGSVMKVKECGTTKFICTLEEDETGRAPARPGTYQMSYDFNAYLFEGGAK